MTTSSGVCLKPICGRGRRGYIDFDGLSLVVTVPDSALRITPNPFIPPSHLCFTLPWLFKRDDLLYLCKISAIRILGNASGPKVASGDSSRLSYGLNETFSVKQKSRLAKSSLAGSNSFRCRNWPSLGRGHLHLIIPDSGITQAIR